MRWLFGSGLVVLGLAATASAYALGPEIGLRAGFGSAGTSSPITYTTSKGARFPIDPGGPYENGSAEYGIGSAFDFSVGFKFAPFLSGGLAAGLRSQSAPDTATTTGSSRTAWSAGIYLRGYIPLTPIIDPFIGIGVRYTEDNQNYTQRYGTSGTLDWTLTHRGVAVPIELGVQYRIIPTISVGPVFTISPTFPAQGCAKGAGTFIATQKECSNDDKVIVTEAKGLTPWSLSLELRFAI